MVNELKPEDIKKMAFDAYCTKTVPAFMAMTQEALQAFAASVWKRAVAHERALTAAQPAQTDSMGMPTSCGKPLCSPDEHHPLCKLHQPAAQAAQVPGPDVVMIGDVVFAGIFEDDVREVTNAAVVRFASIDELSTWNRAMLAAGQQSAQQAQARPAATQAPAQSLQERFNDWADGQHIGDRSDGCGESPDGRDV